MPVTAKDKPLETLRSDTVDQLIMNYGHGKLSLEAFERRLDRAFDASEHDALEDLTADLDLEVDAEYIDRKKQELGLGSGQDRAASVEYVVNVFSGGRRTGAWTVPEELRVIAIFGGTNLDFSEATFSSKHTRVRVMCVFGAVDIFVRESVDTTVKTFCIFGGAHNKVPASRDKDPSRLVVEGFALFGGVTAKIKQTFRERLLKFAADFREMFNAPPRNSRD